MDLSFMVTITFSNLFNDYKDWKIVEKYEMNRIFYKHLWVCNPNPLKTDTLASTIKLRKTMQRSINIL